MDNIMQQLMSQIGDNGLDAMAQKIGADKNQTAEALGGIMPTLLGALTNNAKTEQGASGFLGALDRDHDGSIFDDISGFMSNPDQANGDGILKHALGNNRGQVEQNLSMKTGMDGSQISNLLKMAAPLLMGYLGKQKRSSSSGFDIGSISSLLGGMTQTADKSTGIDLGDVMNIVGGLTGGNNNQSNSGIGGLLGKLFGK